MQTHTLDEGLEGSWRYEYRTSCGCLNRKSLDEPTVVPTLEPTLVLKEIQASYARCEKALKGQQSTECPYESCWLHRVETDSAQNASTVLHFLAWDPAHILCKQYINFTRTQKEISQPKSETPVIEPLTVLEPVVSFSALALFASSMLS